MNEASISSWILPIFLDLGNHTDSYSLHCQSKQRIFSTSYSHTILRLPVCESISWPFPQSFNLFLTRKIVLRKGLLLLRMDCQVAAENTPVVTTHFLRVISYMMALRMLPRIVWCRQGKAGSRAVLSCRTSPWCKILLCIVYRFSDPGW